ncbi:hypothetical protein PMAYCL1PPCAC_32019, partial [Pristionchus mayeri]
PKCQCDFGLLRNAAGECVSKEECDEPDTLLSDDTPKITCANIRCMGRCVDTPTGPNCSGPRPQVLPSWAKDT